MYSKSSILARPGWSAVNFDKLLDEPDELRRVGPGLPNMLYRPDRVIAAEASARFKELRRPISKVSFKIPSTHIQSDSTHFQALCNTRIEVIQTTMGNVRDGAIGHYNAYRTHGFATRQSDSSFLAKIMVQYAKDVLVIYDKDLLNQLVESGDDIGQRAIRYGISLAIAATYKELAAESSNQYMNGS